MVYIPNVLIIPIFKNNFHDFNMLRLNNDHYKDRKIDMHVGFTFI